MSTAAHRYPISVDDYLRGETTARRKHEYVHGVAYAMVGGTNAHNRIATNVTVALGSQLRGKPCQVFNSDTKIRVRTSHGTRFYYPDLSVTCRLNPPGDTYQDAPIVIVEVLSESTRRIDALEKRDAYLSVDSVRVYLRLEQSTPEATVDRRRDGGFQPESYFGPETVIPLPEISCQLAVAELYENVEFPPAVSDDEPEAQ